ncbi:MAG: hypothetical protein AB7E37_04055 [Candidatus Altimarinota bacterium]
MIITQTNLERFKIAYKERHNIDLSDKEATIYSKEIVNFLKLLGEIEGAKEKKYL